MTAIPLFQGENYILNSLGKRVTMGVNENNDWEKARAIQKS